MRVWQVIVIFASLAIQTVAADPFLEKIDVFESGKEDYALYRIPGIVVTAKGTVLAYCEARKTGKSDWDRIDVMMRRSTDGGKTWAPQKNIITLDGKFEKNPVAVAQKLGKPDEITINNPVAIADRKTGSVHFVYCVEYSRCFYMRSDDDGASFSKPVEITSAFEKMRADYPWKVIATGPAHGIQLKNGRLLVPIWLSTGSGGHGHRPSVVSTLFSVDNGQTWACGEIAANATDPLTNPNETVAIQLADGRVMLNIRSESPPNRRALSYSADGATKWTKPVFHEQLLEPVCMASMIRLSESPASDRNRILFSNPDNLELAKGTPKPGSNRDRKNVSIKMSTDEGQSWPVSKSIEPEFSGYSDLAVAADGTILCIYERGSKDGKNNYMTKLLTVARFNLEWLTDGKDTLPPAKP
jgi:sialidase-1